MDGYDGVVAIVGADGAAVGDARAFLTRGAIQDNPTRWAGRLEIPNTPALVQWLRQTNHDIAFRTLDGRPGKCVSYSFPRNLPGSIDVFGMKDAPFD